MSPHAQKTYNPLYTPRKSMRLANYDYQTAGAYAMTICANDRHESPFAMPALENILMEEWNRLPQHFAGITPDLIVIMPDHLHCIIWHHGKGKKTRSIIKVIGGYKSLCANVWRRYSGVVQEGRPINLWQRNFYDHIIRNERDLQAQRAYMLNNPIVAKLKKGQQKVEDACEYNSCGHIPFPPEI